MGLRSAKLALALSGLVVPLLLLEVLARALAPPAIPSLALFRSTPEIGYELRPGHRDVGPRGEAIRIDSSGFRGAGSDDALGAERVLVLGDSFVFGLGVEEEQTFPAALERELGGAVRVLNAGVPGYNLLQSVARLELLSAQLEPRVIVLGFLENDLHNVQSPDHEVTPEGTLRRHPLAYRPPTTVNPFQALADSGPLLWLQLHSAAFRLLSYEVLRWRLRVTGEDALSERARSAEQSSALGDRLLRGDQDDETEPRFRLAEGLLGRAAAAAEASAARLVMVLFPRPEQLFSNQLRGGSRRIAAAAAAVGIEVVDPTEALAAEPDRLGLYLFPEDHHPSARGYAVIAREVARALQRGAGPLGIEDLTGGPPTRRVGGSSPRRLLDSAVGHVYRFVHSRLEARGPRTCRRSANQQRQPSRRV